MRQLLRSTKVFAATLIVLGFCLSGLRVSSVSAATSVVITVESANGSTLTPQSSSVFRLYATSTGGPVFAVGFDVNLTGMSLNSYDSSGSVFNGGSNAPAGNSPGSTTFTVAASYTGSNNGTGKLYIGSFNAKAGNPGSAGVNFTNVEAYDNNVAPIPATGTSSTYTVVSPAPTPAPTVTTTTTTPKPTTATPSTVKPTTAPAAPPSQSRITVPNESGGAPVVTTPEEIAKVAAVDPNSFVSKVSKTKPVYGSKLAIVLPALVAGIALILFGSKLFLARRHRNLMLANHNVSSSTSVSTIAVAALAKEEITSLPVKINAEIPVLGADESRRYLNKE